MANLISIVIVIVCHLNLQVKIEHQGRLFLANSLSYDKDKRLTQAHFFVFNLAMPDLTYFEVYNCPAVRIHVLDSDGNLAPLTKLGERVIERPGFAVAGSACGPVPIKMLSCEFYSCRPSDLFDLKDGNYTIRSYIKFDTPIEEDCNFAPFSFTVKK